MKEQASDMREQLVFPSHFSSTEVTSFTARPANEVWDALSDILKGDTAQTFACALPPLWQFGPRAFWTARMHGKTLSFLSIHNSSLVREVIKEAAIQTVVTTPEFARELMDELVRAQMVHQIKQWLLIVPSACPNVDISGLQGQVFVEKYRSPGILEHGKDVPEVWDPPALEISITETYDRKELLRHVRARTPSHFYREKYALYTEVIDSFLQGAGDWEQVPFLTRTEVARALKTRQWYVDPETVGLLQPTSGTSHAGIMLVPRGLSHITVVDTLHKAPYEHHLPKKFALYFGDHAQYAHIFRKTFGASLLALDPSDVEGSARFVQVFQPDMVGGYVYALEPLAQLLDTTTRKAVRTVQLFGERPSKGQWSYIEQAFPNATVITKYSSMEAQMQIGNGCAELLRDKTPYVHPFTATTYTEVIDTTTGAVLHEPGAEGELVVTTLQHVASPLIRYLTNDRVRIMPPQCSCDRVTYELLGRLDTSVVRVTGGEININAVEQALLQVRHLLTSHAYEVHYSDVKDLPFVRISVQWNEVHITADLLAEQLSRVLYVAPKRTYADAVMDGVLDPLQVTHITTEKVQHKRKGIQRESE